MEDLSEAFGLNPSASALDPETVSETVVSHGSTRLIVIRSRGHLQKQQRVDKVLRGSGLRSLGPRRAEIANRKVRQISNDKVDTTKIGFKECALAGPSVAAVYKFTSRRLYIHTYIPSCKYIGPLRMNESKVWAVVARAALVNPRLHERASFALVRASARAALSA